MNDGITMSHPEPVVHPCSVISYVSSEIRRLEESLGGQLVHLLSRGRIMHELNALVYTQPDCLLCNLCPPGELLLIFQDSQCKLLLLREAS